MNDEPTIEKALTLTEPWATLVILGEKVVETRHDQKPFTVPIPARGMNGLWNWERK